MTTRIVLVSLIGGLFAAGLAPSALAISLLVEPEEATVPPGATQLFSAWFCPPDSFGRPDVGPDGDPGTSDDACSPAPASWSVSGPIGVLLSLFGPTTTFFASGSPGATGAVRAAASGQTASATVTITAPPATLTIVKEATPDDPQDFEFKGDLSFTLDDDGNDTAKDPPTGMFPRSETFELAPGTYRVSEVLPGRWFLRDVECPGAETTPVTAPTRNPLVTEEVDVFTVTLKPGDDVTCTVRNDKAGSITVVKDTVPDDPRDFEFLHDFHGSLEVLTLDDDGAIGALPRGQQFIVQPRPSPYTVTEADASGYVLSITCIGDGSWTINNEEGSASITVGPGGFVECTFVNEKDDDGDGVANGADLCLRTVVRDPVGDPVDRTTGCTSEQLGSITVVKEADPAKGDPFDFVGTLPDFVLRDGGAAPHESETFSRLVPGPYKIVEIPNQNPVFQWNVTGIECLSGGAPKASKVSGSSVEFELAQGEYVTCTFTNVQNGAITIVKDAVPNDRQDFHFTGPGANDAFDLDDDSGAVGEDAFLSDRTTFLNLTPYPAYSVDEALPPPGWVLVNIFCDDRDATPLAPGKRSVTIPVAPGAHVTCTFVNFKLTGSEHYLGYEVRSERPVLAGEDMVLSDQFGEERVHVSNARLLLNPVEKRRAGKPVEPIQRPDDHLKCYRITGGLRRDKNVRVFNQFTPEGATLLVKEPNRLCAPATKALDEPPLLPPFDRQHYKCYRVEEEPRLMEEQAELADQFGLLPVIVRRAEALCNPVTKKRDGREPEPPPRPQEHLVCYGINESVPFAPRDVFTRDQFITQRVLVEDPLVLCVPSTKVEAPAP